MSEAESSDTGSRAVRSLLSAGALAALALVVCASVLIGGCSSQGGGGSAGSASSMDPGLQTMRGGRVVVVGTLVHESAAPRTWVVVASRPGASRSSARVLASVSNPDQISNLVDLENRYVVVRGTPASGAAPGSTGQALHVDSISPAQEK